MEEKCIISGRAVNCVSARSPAVSERKKKQADTHHQQGKKDDPTAPDVCFPPVILLSLRTPKCLLAGRCSAWLKDCMKKLLLWLEPLKNALPWWPLGRHSAEICWRNGQRFSLNKLNTKKEAGERVGFKGFFFPIRAPAKSGLRNQDSTNNEKKGQRSRLKNVRSTI